MFIEKGKRHPLRPFYVHFVKTVQIALPSFPYHSICKRMERGKKHMAMRRFL